jgi:hypothetical protein
MAKTPPPASTRRWWMALFAVLAVSLAAEIFLPRDGHFGVDGVFGFGAWFGFAACAGLIVLSKLLGIFLKRPDGYYGD